MSSIQQKNQVMICVLKSNLEEIGNELAIQNSTIPVLDNENECKYRKTMEYVQVLRAIATEIEHQKGENLKLAANRKQLQLNCEEMTKTIDKALEMHNENNDQLDLVENEIEQKICSYEDFLREKADCFRKTNYIYEDIEMKRFDIVKEDLNKMRAEEDKQQNLVKELKNELDSIVLDLPDNILAIVRKPELENKLKTLSDNCKEKRDTLDWLQKKRKYGFNF